MVSPHLTVQGLILGPVYTVKVCVQSCMIKDLAAHIFCLMYTDWQRFQGFQRLRSSTPSPPPVTVQVGEPGENSHEVIHHDGQVQGDPHDDVHEEVRVLLVMLLFNQTQCDKTESTSTRFNFKETLLLEKIS